MLFERYPRYQGFTMTDRRIAAFLRKQKKELARYPLFPEHIQAEQVSLDDEIVKRVQSALKGTQDMRDRQARSWRKQRAAYFAQPADVKATIRAKWAVWTGPRTPTYLAWMIDTESGEQARRVAVYREEERQIRAMVRKQLAQPSIFQS